jgi:hypothetical protein
MVSQVMVSRVMAWRVLVSWVMVSRQDRTIPSPSGGVDLERAHQPVMPRPRRGVWRIQWHYSRRLKGFSVPVADFLFQIQAGMADTLRAGGG